MSEADKEALKLARLKVLQAEEKKHLSEARFNDAEALKAEIEAEGFQVDLEKKLDERKAVLANDIYNKVFYFATPVSEKSVKDCMQRLAYWARTEPGCDIEIVFNSPGGDVTDGLALFDYIQSLVRAGHDVTTTALGMAASMAGILLQAGSRRRIGKEAWLLIHQASFGAVGSYGEVEDRLKWVEKVQERIIDVFATRAAESGAEKPMTRAQIKKNWNRKDWWISSDECLKYGFVDEVV
jgi:ATP-dependent Clp protease protease subunit